MTAMPAAQPMTAEEFLALPLDMDEYGFAPCLVEGELVVNRPNVDHQEIGKRLLIALDAWIRSAQGGGYVIGEIDLLIDDDNVYEPDVLWYEEGRGPGRRDVAPYPVPELAVEIGSASTWHYDIGPKKTGYERAGLRELWLVDTKARTVLAFKRSTPETAVFDITVALTRDDVLASPLLPGFTLPVDQLFTD